MAVVLLSRRWGHPVLGVTRVLLLHAEELAASGAAAAVPPPTPSHRVLPPNHAWGLRSISDEEEPAPLTAARVADILTQGRGRAELRLCSARKLEHDVVAYHLEFTSDAAADTYTSLMEERPVAWVTWKEVEAATRRPPHPADPREWTRGAVFHTPIAPRAAVLITAHLAPRPLTDPAAYDVVYHGTTAVAETPIVHIGFRPSPGGTSMMGPGVYTCHFPKACRFAMFDAAKAHTPRPHVAGTVLRVLVCRRDARTARVDAVNGPMCCCHPCHGRGTGRRAQAVRRVVDHRAVWAEHADVLEVPAVPAVTALPELVVKDPARVRVLSAATVRGVVDAGADPGKSRNYAAATDTGGAWVRHVMLDAVHGGPAFFETALRPRRTFTRWGPVNTTVVCPPLSPPP